MRIYLDNCSYNRPYDDQSQLRISLESQAKLYIQDMIKENRLELASSYTLTFENSQNPYDFKRKSIDRFLEDNTTVYVDETFSDKVNSLAIEIMKAGVKTADAHHVASAIIAGCDYLVTTDDRLLKFKSNQITILDPIDFIKQVGGNVNE